MRIFPHATVQTKEETLLGAFTPQLPFQGKVTRKRPQSIIIGANVKSPIFLHPPPSHYPQCKEYESPNDEVKLSHLQFPMISMEHHIPTPPLPHHLPHQQSLNWSFLLKRILIQDQESHFERLVTALTIMPKPNLTTYTNLKQNILTKPLPTHPNTPPKTTTMRTPTQLQTPSPQLKFSYHQFLYLK